MHRFFVPPQQVRGSTITLNDPAEIHHLRDVLRLGRGDEVVCFDGRGMEYAGTIAQVTSRQLIVQVARRIDRSLGRVRLWLAPSLLKADRFDWVVQKATELGASRLSPLITQHTIVRPTPEQGRAKRLRWQRIAQEAATQCGRATIPTVDPPQALEPFLRLAERASLLLIPTLAATAIPLGEVLKAQPAVRDVTVLIGPEGDFTPEEVALAERYEARPVSLGSLTLRAETAALATIAILRYALGQR